MLPSMSLRGLRAAWVPPTVTGKARLRSVDHAVSWVRAAADSGLELMFFHPARNDWEPPTRAVASLADDASRRMNTFDRYQSHDEGRAVLAIVDNYTDFAIAQSAARCSYLSDKLGSLALVSGGLRGLEGWARSSEAFDLSTGRNSMDSFAASQIELLQDLVRGLLSHSPGMGRDAVDSSLQRLRERDDFDPGMIQGFAMADGVTGKRLEHLARLLDG